MVICNYQLQHLSWKYLVLIYLSDLSWRHSNTHIRTTSWLVTQSLNLLSFNPSNTIYYLPAKCVPNTLQLLLENIFVTWNHIWMLWKITSNWLYFIKAPQSFILYMIIGLWWIPKQMYPFLFRIKQSRHGFDWFVTGSFEKCRHSWHWSSSSSLCG